MTDDMTMKRLFKAAEREPQDGESREVGLAREVSRLRAQVAELLPWAKAAAGNLLPFGTGLTADDGERLLERIEAGEFGEI